MNVIALTRSLAGKEKAALGPPHSIKVAILPEKYDSKECNGVQGKFAEK